MLYLENKSDVNYTRCKFPLLTINHSGGNFNTLAKELIPTSCWGVKFEIGEDCPTYIEFVPGGANKTTFGLSKTQGIRVNGAKLRQFFGFVQFELIATEDMYKYLLSPLYD